MYRGMTMLRVDSISVTKLILFLRGGTKEDIDFVLNFWKGNDILEVVPWSCSGDGNWALHINLKALNKPGEEAYIPIAWAESGRPTVAEAADTFRCTVVRYR